MLRSLPINELHPGFGLWMVEMLCALYILNHKCLLCCIVNCAALRIIFCNLINRQVESCRSGTSAKSCMKATKLLPKKTLKTTGGGNAVREQNTWLSVWILGFHTTLKLDCHPKDNSHFISVLAGLEIKKILIMKVFMWWGSHSPLCSPGYLEMCE